jgi:hypothetical protein
MRTTHEIITNTDEARRLGTASLGRVLPRLTNRSLLVPVARVRIGEPMDNRISEIRKVIGALPRTCH